MAKRPVRVAFAEVPVSSPVYYLPSVFAMLVPLRGLARIGWRMSLHYCGTDSITRSCLLCFNNLCLRPMLSTGRYVVKIL
jgi:hypothetical protein